jgi:hypothetical protein
VHDVAAGVLVCPATPGAPWPVLVRDLLLALGKQRRALELAGRRSRLPEVLAVWIVRRQDRHRLLGHVRRAHAFHRVGVQLALGREPLGELLQRPIPEGDGARLPAVGEIGQVVLDQRAVEVGMVMLAGICREVLGGVCVGLDGARRAVAGTQAGGLWSGAGSNRRPHDFQ